MTVIVVTQYSGGTPAQIGDVGPKIKQAILRHGALFYRVGQIFAGGTLGDTRSTASEARDAFLAAGASDYLFTRVTVGPRLGQWMSSARFADWAAYGAAQDKLAADPAFATLLARVAGWAELTERFLIGWTDI